VTLRVLFQENSKGIHSRRPLACGRFLVVGLFETVVSDGRSASNIEGVSTMSVVTFKCRRNKPLGAPTWLCGSLVLCSLLVVTACSGDSEDRSQSQSQPVTIRGGERLAWNQAADSVLQLSSLTFRLYVDGRESSLSATKCDEVVRPAGFECSGNLPPMSPGQHTLELTSMSGGIESDRSQQLIVMVAASASTSGHLSSEVDGQSASPNSKICASEPQADCYGVHLVASGLGTITGLTPLPDGRVIFIEAGHQIRVIVRDTLRAAIVLSADMNRQLTGLAIDAQFNTSRSVFVAWTELARDVPRLSITRYRELENVLGQGATIATALPATPGSLTPLAVDDNGLIYVAVPVDRSALSTGFLGGAGTVMRFDRDGRVPASNRNASPVMAEGYPVPLALAIDRSDRTVWLTGRDFEQFGNLATFAIQSGDRGSWPIRPVAALGTAYEHIDSVAIIDRVGVGNDGIHLVIAAGGQLREVLRTPRGAGATISDISLGDGYFAHGVAVDRDGDLYVSATTPAGSVSVLKLTKSSK
jgi:glucose/sorbosone dehydrogenase